MVQEAVVFCTGRYTMSEFQIPEGYVLVPKSLLESLQGQATKKEEGGVPCLVLRKVFLGDCKQRLERGEIVFYEENEFLKIRGKKTHELLSFETFLKAQEDPGYAATFLLNPTPEDIAMARKSSRDVTVASPEAALTSGTTVKDLSDEDRKKLIAAQGGERLERTQLSAGGVTPTTPETIDDIQLVKSASPDRTVASIPGKPADEGADLPDEEKMRAAERASQVLSND